MQRDFSKYPNDDNGNVLWRLLEHGDDHSVSRDIDFCLDFPTEVAAVDCGVFLFRNEYKIQLEPPIEDDPESPWTVLAIPHMAPEYSEICAVESHLKEIAQHFGGECSGWGCPTAGAL